MLLSVSCLKNYKCPVTQTDMRPFLGLTSYYRRFVDYTSIAKPLAETAKKKEPRLVTWMPERLVAFAGLCKLLSELCV